MTGAITVVGDCLLDRDLVGQARRLCPDAAAPVLESVQERARPGGAGLAAVLLARGQRPVTLVTALAPDAGGARLRELLADHGVAVVDLGADAPTTEKVRVGTGGQVLVRLDCSAASPRVGAMTDEARAAVADAAAVLVSDYGRGVTAQPTVRAALADLASRGRRLPVVWDPHPAGAAPVPGVQLLSPNRAEAGLVPGASWAEVTAAGRRLLTEIGAAGVAVTLGPQGALLVTGIDEPPLVVAPAEPSAGNACGAGDSFAAAAVTALAHGAVLSEAVHDAVESAAAFVASGGAASVGVTNPRGTPHFSSPARHENTRQDSNGEVIVATGGCFDILHAGHVALLQAARALGDRLVVCLNSDRSVRRLKGPGRPLQPETDRRALLSALTCVDEVQIFDDDTPIPLLRRLRPDVFVKGADYSAATLPEAAVLAEWGGQAVVLPCVPGRSTTHVLEEAIRHAHTIH
ncbi:MAG: PfkB family carbohydrate kinase [Acidimicrobiales bacterium]